MSKTIPGWLQSLTAQVNVALKQNGQRGDHALLDDDEITAFEDAALSRESAIKPNVPLSKLLKRKNRWRFHRLRSDYAWAVRVARRNGHDVEGVRWLL